MTPPSDEAYLLDEPWWRRWGRRSLTIPAIGLGLLLSTVLFPVLLPILAVVDLFRRPRISVRLLCVVWFYFAAEICGLLSLLFIWLFSRFVFGKDRRQRWMLTWVFRVQAQWGAILLGAFCKLFRLRLAVDVQGGQAALLSGPAVVMLRHCSLFDTLLATPLLSKAHGIRLRYVLKRELLLDPCMDVAGNLLPNYFVRRDSSQSAMEIKRIRSLAGGISDKDWGLIYPEGTRVTKSKQARALARLKASDEDLYQRALLFTEVLPPQLGGPLAMLEGAPRADVVFITHYGLEGITKMKDLWQGHLFDKTIYIRLWRVPRSSLPPIGQGAGRGQVEWLYDRWNEINTWLKTQAQAAQAAQAPQA